MCKAQTTTLIKLAEVSKHKTWINFQTTFVHKTQVSEKSIGMSCLIEFLF